MSAPVRLKQTALIALGALIILLAGAIVFYKERMLFADAPYIAFNIINHNSFGIQVGRYGAFITQMVPYFCGRLHLSISTILLLYSVSFNAFYLLVAILLVYWFRQPRLAILMALYYFLFVSDCYFWTNNEIHQAIAWMFLFVGCVTYLGMKQVNGIITTFVFIALAFITLSTHFVVIIPAFFLLVYIFLEKDQWLFSPRYTALLAACLLSVLVGKYLAASAHPYETEHLRNITHVSLPDILHSLHTPVVRLFFYRCITNYWLALPVFLSGLWALKRAGNYRLLIWTALSTVGYFVIMGITYAGLDPDTPLYHIESEWASISVIVAAPFVFAVLPVVNARTSILLLIFIFVVRLGYIGSALPAFQWRVRFQEKVLAQMQKQNLYKLAIYNNSDIRQKYMLDWAAPYESIFVSCMNHENPQRTFCFVNKDDSDALHRLQNTSVFLEAWGMLPAASLNPAYFHIDTTQSYSVMTYEQLFSR